MTRTFLVTVTIDDEEDVEETADEIYDQLTPNFGDDVSVKPWASPGEAIFPQT